MKHYISIVMAILAIIGALSKASDPVVKEVHVLHIPEEQVVVVEPDEELQEEEYFDSLDMLASCVMAEAGNQGLMGKRLVVDVILNRVDSDRFPNDIVSVITQTGQFAVYPYAMTNIVPDDETFEAIRMELEKRTDTEILFFSAGKYNSCCTPAYKHGDHYFGY